MRFAVVLDFDGVVVDSYSCLPRIYGEIASMLGVAEPGLFVDAMLMVEDLANYTGHYRVADLWRPVFDSMGVADRLDEMHEYFWERRTELSRPFCDVDRFASALLDAGAEIHVVSGCDDAAERKIRRVEASGIARYASSIAVHGHCNPGAPDARRILEGLARRYDATLYVDDKPGRLNRLAGTGAILVLHRFVPPLPLALAWRRRLRVPARVLDDMCALPGLLEDLLRRNRKV